MSSTTQPSLAIAAPPPAPVTGTANTSSQVTFHEFSRFPTEIRIKIYPHCDPTQVIIWGRSGVGRKMAPMFLVSKEAHDELAKLYKTFTPHQPGKKTPYTLTLDVEKDILYRKALLPKMYFDSQVFNSMITSQSVEWVKEVRYLALDFGDVMSIILKRERTEPNLWNKLALMCPKLKELLVIYGNTKPNQGDSVIEKLDNEFSIAERITTSLIKSIFDELKKRGFDRDFTDGLILQDTFEPGTVQIQLPAGNLVEMKFVKKV